MHFIERHTPRCVADLVFENTANATVIAQYAAAKQTRHLLLHGPAGSGKSEAAKIIINSCVPHGVGSPCNQPIHAMTYDHDDFSPVFNDWGWQMSTYGSSRGYTVIDEIDQFQPKMRHTLRALMDERGDTGTIICTTNNLHLLDAPLRDRFTILEILRPSLQDWTARIIAIFRAEGITLTSDQVQMLFANFAGSARDLMRLAENYVGEFRANPATYASILVAKQQQQQAALPAPPVANRKTVIVINKRP